MRSKAWPKTPTPAAGEIELLEFLALQYHEEVRARDVEDMELLEGGW